MLKKIIIITVIGIISFGATFTFSLLKAKAKAAEKSAQENAKAAEIKASKAADKQQATFLGNSTHQENNEAAIQEKQLKKLIFNVREKITEYNHKTQSLTVKEERLKTTYKMIRKDLDDLNKLRTELASTVADLKQKQQQLENSMVEIEKVEQQNLVSIAATYDKMDPASAAVIMTNMSKVSDSKKSSDIDDAVKILYYMTERTKAKVLAEMTKTQPEITALFCKKLKKIVVEDNQ
ncbi:MAG: hypothetical protein KAS96_08495 [Planctomycetes bacterium]|nr:hypothetical protein [Planctomycetota bacterium]